ncbi:conserved oligomeric Golgi complex subunit 8 isoform X2 [Drosophila innubila]|uniref:conserved oligomeric Golgi complex subunit 8 isoform X2 n=1 Tax=Drosophila innubila TaxID=198719 RepID=UPI00148BA71B|nr:conserved oligomeric Golgi complex subunit 8 isoform X2 [Drosophila innubila]
MADTINKPSIQIRSGLPSPLPDKSPSPATKLLISHGKPNFTIARSPSVKDNGNPLSPQPNANNNYNAYKSANNNNVNNNNKFVVGTKFNGVFKPSNAAATWATSNGNANGNGATDQNEAAKVVLRRPKLADVEPVATTAEDENVPEFIRRQRRIQERLAKENVLDFENRRSGYFTHVMISPDSPNRTSFVETMASPAIVPSLEMPLPARIEEEQPQITNGHSEPEARSLPTNGHREAEVESSQAVSNGHAQDDVAAEEVAKAIEEVNKAVAGEDDAETVETVEAKPQVEVVVPAAVEAQVEVITPVAAVEPVSPPVQNGDAARDSRCQRCQVRTRESHSLRAENRRS